MSQALTLFRLQQIDLQLDRAKSRLEIIQKTLEDGASLKQLFQLAVSAADDQLNAEEKQTKAEADVQSLRIKIEQIESSLYGGAVHSPKELQDLQNDVAALKRYLVTLEDQLLESMLAAEEAQVRNHKEQSTLLAAQSGREAQNLNLHQELTSLTKDIQTLNTERLAITGTIDAGQKSLYEQLRLERRGVAVTGVQENTCSACGATLTLAQVQISRSSTQLARCPSCGRILYGS
jgi:predicted  nucleic acid-binding Zn-ribbon protein